MEDKSPLQLKLAERLQSLLPADDAPQALKEEVFSTLRTLELFGDIADLFTAKFTLVEAEFLGLTQTEQAQEEEE